MHALTFFLFYFFFLDYFELLFMNHCFLTVRNTNTVCSEEVRITTPGQILPIFCFTLWPVAQIPEKVSRNSEINKSVAGFLSKSQEVCTVLMPRAPGVVIQEQRTSHTALGSGGIELRHALLSWPDVSALQLADQDKPAPKPTPWLKFPPQGRKLL